MQDLVDRVSIVLKGVATESGLPLAEDKEEQLILYSRGGKQGRRGVCDKVKGLGVILYKDLDFGAHWEARIAKSRSLLDALDEVDSSS